MTGAFLLIGVLASTGAAPAAYVSHALERAAELMKIAATGDSAAVVGYVERSYAPSFLASAPMEMHLGFLAQLVDGTGGIRVHEILRGDDHEAVVIYLAPLTGEWRELRLQVEPESPHRIAGLRPPRGTPPPPGQAPEPRRLSPEQVAGQLDEYARRLAEADAFSGGVLVAQRNVIIHHGAYGAASREFHVPNNPDTRFIIGSLNKMFTTVGILQLVERGALALSDPVDTHLPGVLPAGLGAKVQIEHLLTHTSGLGDFLFTPEILSRSRLDFRTIADYLPLLASASPRFEPGAGWFYSNAGFLLLGAIIEKVAGVPYDDFVAMRVFAPAGMTATGAPDLDLVPHGLASTYQREYAGGRPRFRNDRYLQPVRGTPAGGGFSTTGDLFRFARALRENRLLSPEMTRRMLAPKPELGSMLYGYGTQMFSADGERWGHTGGGPGTSAMLHVDVENDLIIVILGNQNTGSGSVLRRARQLIGVDTPSQSW